MTSSRGQLSEMRVKSRRSQIKMAARTVVPLPRLRGAGQNHLAGMRADIGFEQRSRQAVLDADFADQRQRSATVS